MAKKKYYYRKGKGGKRIRCKMPSKRGWGDLRIYKGK